MSWAEEMEIDGYELPEQSVSKNYEWEDRTHGISLIEGLETTHIQNIIRGLEAGKWYFGQSHKLDYLKKELKDRLTQLKENNDE